MLNEMVFDINVFYFLVDFVVLIEMNSNIAITMHNDHIYITNKYIKHLSTQTTSLNT